MYEKEKEELLAACDEMIREDLVIISAGNASIRVSEEHAVITPSSVPYTTMTLDDVVVVNMDGDVIEAERNASVETPTHLEIYKQREDVNAVVHSHSVYATALAVLHKPVPPILDEVVPKLGGEIRGEQIGCAVSIQIPALIPSDQES